RLGRPPCPTRRSSDLAELPTRIQRVRELGEHFRESEVIGDMDAIPHFPAREIASVRTGEVEAGPSGFALARWLVRQLKRHAMTQDRKSTRLNSSAVSI